MYLRLTSAVLISAAPVAAQAPHVQGRVAVRPADGALDASLCTSRFVPRRPVRFLLAASLSIKHVTDGDGRVLAHEGEYDGRIVGEAREYVVRQAESLPPLTTFCVEYRGVVPVFDTNSADSDWKGRIAAIDGTLRASEQTRWYPTLFDSASSSPETSVSYRLQMECPGCGAIYVNGAAVVRDTAGSFESVTPRPLLLFAGRVRVQQTGSVTFLGGSADAATARVFSEAIDRIAEYYSAFLGVRRGSEVPVLLSFRSVSRDRPLGQSTWQFVTWPTIAFSGGIDFDRLLEAGATGPELPEALWATFSHEMAHYYFGTVRKPHGPLRWVVLESTAEYLSLKSLGAFRGELAVLERVVNYLGESGNPRQYPRLAEVTNSDEVNGTYRYRLAPLYLLHLEHLAGATAVARMLRALLESPESEPANYSALRRAAETAGIRPEILAQATAPELIDGFRAEMLARARARLVTHADSVSGARVLSVAVALVNADTTVEGRLGVMRVLQRLLGREPGNLRAHYQVGRIGALTGRELDSALGALQRYVGAPARAGDPPHAAAYWRIGMIHEHRNDARQAGTAYRKALELDPAYTAARQALERLESRGTP